MSGFSAPTRFRHVTRRLRDLAGAEEIDLTGAHPLTDAISETLRLGSRDVLFHILLEQLTVTQEDLALQAGLLTAPFAPLDILHSISDQRGVLGDVERLRELTLLSPAPHNSELVVQPWIGHALRQRLPEDQLILRHRRAADMRLNRITSGRGGFDDIIEHITHLAGCKDYDIAVDTALLRADMVGSEAAASVLLAEVLPLIPTSHPRYLALADRECDALARIGLIGATTGRRQALLSITRDRAAADPDNAVYQRDLSAAYSKLGDLAVAIGDTRAAEQHYRAALTIPERLTAGDPDNDDAH